MDAPAQVSCRLRTSSASALACKLGSGPKTQKLSGCKPEIWTVPFVKLTCQPGPCLFLGRLVADGAGHEGEEATSPETDDRFLFRQSPAKRLPKKSIPAELNKKVRKFRHWCRHSTQQLVTTESRQEGLIATFRDDVIEDIRGGASVVSRNRHGAKATRNGILRNALLRTDFNMVAGPAALFLDLPGVRQLIPVRLRGIKI